VQTGATVVTSKAEEYRAASFDAHNRSVSVRASLPDAARVKEKAHRSRALVIPLLTEQSCNALPHDNAATDHGSGALAKRRFDAGGAQMFNTEWFETLFGTLSLMSMSLSVHQWHYAMTVPSFPDQPSIARAWQSRLHARKAGSAAVFALFFQGLLMISHAIEGITS
jgi:hypothetical protein